MGESGDLEPWPEGFEVSILGFELLEFSVGDRIIAIRERGRAPICRPNPFPPDHVHASEAERALALLGWGTGDAPASHLDEDAFRAAEEALAPYVDRLIVLPERPVDANGNAAGLAWCLCTGPSGFAIYRAVSPHDILPEAPDLGPLGRSGYWGGSPDALIWLGDSRDDLVTAMNVVHRFELASWGVAFYERGIRRPTAVQAASPTPSGVFDQLLDLYHRGRWHPPGGELRVAIDGRWAGTARAACALCGAPTGLTRFGYGGVIACDPCRHRIGGALVARLVDLLRGMLARRLASS